MSPQENTDHKVPASPMGFATTHWSVVLAASDPQAPQARDALEQLCRAYWYPLYGFVRKAGYAHEDAQDLTQEFFARLLARNDFARADRSRGRFRAYLLGALRHFLADERDKALARKRGGAFQIISLDDPAAEARLSAEPAAADPEQLYDRRWALTLLSQVLRRLGEEFAAAGKTRLFEELQVFLTMEKQDISYDQAARRLGLTDGAVRVAVHRMRQRYGEIFREEIAHTVARPEEIDGEIRHLLAVLGQ